MTTLPTCCISLLPSIFPSSLYNELAACLNSAFYSAGVDLAVFRHAANPSPNSHLCVRRLDALRWHTDWILHGPLVPYPSAAPPRESDVNLLQRPVCCSRKFLLSVVQTKDKLTHCARSVNAKQRGWILSRGWRGEKWVKEFFYKAACSLRPWSVLHLQRQHPRLHLM